MVVSNIFLVSPLYLLGVSWFNLTCAYFVKRCNHQIDPMCWFNQQPETKWSNFEFRDVTLDNSRLFFLEVPGDVTHLGGGIYLRISPCTLCFPCEKNIFFAARNPSLHRKAKMQRFWWNSWLRKKLPQLYNDTLNFHFDIDLVKLARDLTRVFRPKWRLSKGNPIISGNKVVRWNIIIWPD